MNEQEIVQAWKNKREDMVFCTQSDEKVDKMRMRTLSNTQE